MGLLEGKCALVVGVANERSIAWGVARALSREGARLALTYQGDRVKGKVEACAAEIPDTIVLPLDAGDDVQIEAVYQRLREEWGRLDTLVHSIAYAPAEELKGRFLDTSREGFRTALEVSAYSLVAITRPAVPLMEAGGSIMAMTYLGSDRVFPGYNVMGVAKAALESTVRYLAADLGPQNIRVNAISAGPVNTLSARGVSGFTSFARETAERSPLQRRTTPEEVGDTGVYLASDLSRAVTGETIFVDEGYHVLGI